MPKIIVLVLPVCRGTPLGASSQRRVEVVTSLISSAVTIHGPVGPKVSQPYLPHCEPLRLSWNSRSETSFTTQ